jgi:hypothetical protein
MAERQIIQHLRTNELNVKPNSNDIEYGEIAINYKKDNERLFVKNDNDEIVEDAENFVEERKIEPVLLATFEDLVSAEIFKDVLTDNKIPYSDSQEDTMRVVFGGSFASEEIYVDESDYNEAKELYDEFMANEPEFSDDDLFFEE